MRKQTVNATLNNRCRAFSGRKSFWLPLLLGVALLGEGTGNYSFAQKDEAEALRAFGLEKTPDGKIVNFAPQELEKLLKKYRKGAAEPVPEKMETKPQVVPPKPASKKIPKNKTARKKAPPAPPKITKPKSPVPEGLLKDVTPVYPPAETPIAEKPAGPAHPRFDFPSEKVENLPGVKRSLPIYILRDWEGLCAHLAGVNLHERYDASRIVFNYQVIRSDFLSKYNQLIEENLVFGFFEPTGNRLAAKELGQTKMIVGWQSGNNLIVALGKDYANRFSFYENRFKRYVNPGTLTTFRQIPEGCVYVTMNAGYQTIQLKGPNGEKAEIPLMFYLSDRF